MLVVSHLCGDTVLTLHVACREAINQMSDFTNTGALNFLLCSSTSSSSVYIHASIMVEYCHTYHIDSNAPKYIENTWDIFSEVI